MIKLQELIPGTLTDIRKDKGDVWQLVFSKRWAAIGPKGWRMAYKANRHGKKNAEMWAKKGKDLYGNSDAQMKKDDIKAYGKEYKDLYDAFHYYYFTERIWSEETFPKRPTND